MRPVAPPTLSPSLAPYAPPTDSLQALHHRIQEVLIQADVALTTKNISVNEKGIVVEHQDNTLKQQAVTIEYLRTEVEKLRSQSRRAETLEKAIEGARDIEDLKMLKEGLKKGRL